METKQYLALARKPLGEVLRLLDINQRDVYTDLSKLVNLPVYANNGAALAAGLVQGSFYRTGGDPDLVCVVH